MKTLTHTHTQKIVNCLTLDRYDDREKMLMMEYDDDDELPLHHRY